MSMLSYHCNHDSCSVFHLFSLYFLYIEVIRFYNWKKQKLLLPGINFSTISPFIPEIPPSLPICHITTPVPILFKGLLHSFMLQDIRLLKSLLPSGKEIAQTSLVLGLPCHSWLKKINNQKKTPKKHKKPPTNSTPSTKKKQTKKPNKKPQQKNPRQKQQKTPSKLKNELCQNFHFPNGIKCLFYVNKGFVPCSNKPFIF